MSSTEVISTATPVQRQASFGPGPAWAVLAIVWLSLWLAGFPLPNVDDGFFTGVGISLARDGQLANPWVTGWMGYLEGVDPGRFLVQPPLYPLVMAGWIAGLGVSAASLTGFACCLGFLSCGLAWLLLSRLTGDRLAAALGTAVIGATLLQRGLRPEPLAMLCFLAGQWLLLTRHHPAAWLTGGIANSMAVLAHPIWAILVIPATAFQLVHAWRSRWPVRPRLTALLGGIAGTALALLAYLGHSFPAFLHDLVVHGRFVSQDMNRWVAFATHLSLGYEGYFVGLLSVLAIAAAVVAARNHRRGVQAIGVGAGLMLVLGLALYPAQATVYWVRSLAILPLLFPRTGLNRWLAPAPAVLFVAWFSLQTGLQRAADRQWDDRPRRAALASYLERAQPELVMFDAATLRWQFDYRPPHGAIDVSWAWAPGHPDRYRDPRAMQARDLWVIDPAWWDLRLPARVRRGNLELAHRTFKSVRSSRACLVLAGPDLPPADGLPVLRSSAL